MGRRLALIRIQHLRLVLHLAIAALSSLRFPIKLARRVAGLSDHRRFMHSAIVMRGGAIIAIGHNHAERHAEAVALGKLWPSKREGSILLSLRVTKTGRIAMAKPCKECESLCKRNRVRIAWSDREGGIRVA